MNYNKEIGARLKEARKKRGYTQEAIANRFAVDKSSISKYENGISSPDVEFLKEFSEYLNINGDWLLFGEPPIFRAAAGHRDVEGLFLQLMASLKGAAAETAKKDYLPVDVKKSLAGLTEETPENFALLFEYMLKHPTARQDVFKYFHLFVKPVIDKACQSDE